MEPPRGLADKPYLVVKLLNALKGFYTFKELEERLGVPYQLLWRYTSLNTVPERRTARRILEVVEREGLVRRAISRVVARNALGYVEEWKYLYNYRFLCLAGYEAYKFLNGGRAGAVLACPESSSTLGVAVSEWVGGRACAAMHRLPLSVGRHLRASYKSRDRGEVVQVYVPREALREGDRVLLVRGVVKNLDSLDAIIEILEGVGARLLGVLAVASVSEEWRDRCKEHGVEKAEALCSFPTPPPQNLPRTPPPRALGGSASHSS